MSAQDSIPYQRMFPDGICRVTDTFYTKTVQFQDVNYQLCQNEDKTAIFEGWSDFLNYFDSSIHFQLSFLNLSASQDGFSRNIVIPLQPDGFDDVREEYSEMLQNQLAKGNNGLAKTKYLTFGINAENIKTAKPRLERIETDVSNNFKRLGVSCSPMNGMERLRLLHAIFHMDGQEQARVVEDLILELGAGELPRIDVFNKSDLLPPGEIMPHGEDICAVSARTGEGVDKLLETIARRLDKGARRVTVRLPYDQGGLLDMLYQEAKVEKVDYGATIDVTAVCGPRALGRVAAFIDG